MGGLISLIICIVAASRVYSEGSVIFYISIIVALLNFWSFGVMYNFRDNPIMAPNFWTKINMITTFASIGFLIFSIFK